MGEVYRAHDIPVCAGARLWRPPLQFVEEVQQEIHVDVSRSAAGRLRREEHDEALAVRRQIQRWIMVRELNRRFGPLVWRARREGVASVVRQTDRNRCLL